MAGILTKPAERATLQIHIVAMGCMAETGRADCAPELIHQHYVQILYVPTGIDVRPEE